MVEAMREIEKHLAILEKYLQGKTFLVAEQFSVADKCYVPFLEFLPLMEIVPPKCRRGVESAPIGAPEFGLDATGEVAFYIIAYAVRSGSQASHRSA